MKALCLPGVNENTNLRSYYIDRWYCVQRKLRKILRQIKLLCKEYSLLFELVKKEGNKVSWKQNHVQPKSLCFIFCKFRSKKWAFNEQTFQMNCFCCFLVCSVWWYESIWKKEYRIKKGILSKQSETKNEFSHQISHWITVLWITLWSCSYFWWVVYFLRMFCYAYKLGDLNIEVYSNYKDHVICTKLIIKKTVRK